MCSLEHETQKVLHVGRALCQVSLADASEYVPI